MSNIYRDYDEESKKAIAEIKLNQALTVGGLRIQTNQTRSSTELASSKMFPELGLLLFVA